MLAIVLTLLATIKGAPNQTAKWPQLEIAFRKQSGGLLSLLRFPETDLPSLTGMTIYTDWGILRPERHEPIGSQNEFSPKVIEQIFDGSRFVTVEGQLKDSQGQPCGLRYQVVHKLVANTLTVDISLKAERNFNSMHGFLAAMLTFSGANEWFARTKKGWVFADILREGRVFQSAHTPLDDKEPTIGIANFKSGLAIALTIKEVEPKDILENVLIHANFKGIGGIFIAWCDGILGKEMKIGEIWRIFLILKFLRLNELFSLE